MGLGTAGIGMAVVAAVGVLLWFSSALAYTYLLVITHISATPQIFQSVLPFERQIWGF
jgi:hypothetical protein